MTPRNAISMSLVCTLAACAADAPPRYAEVVTMRAGEAAPQSAPPPGTVWRLEAQALSALSPAPYVEPPPPPRHPPPPRPNDPPPAYYSAPYPYYGPHYGPYFGPYWGSGLYLWRRW